MATRGTGSASSKRSYGEMRDFARTAEPRPDPAAAARRAGQAPIFVVQKHDASRLHWDFRLEHGGVLWSWAVPKGPSLDPHDKRLAMHVEDHPVDYATFEGTIPPGNYGAGTVEIWDRGTWQPVADDAAAALAKGELKFRLDGERLRGGFVLVRLKPRGREQAESWLLIKEHDAHEREGADATALEARPLPAREPAARIAPEPGKPRSRRPSPAADGDALPETQAPQLAQLARTPPSGPGWISEVKFDGYRMLVRKDRDQVRIITRNGLDWTARLPALAEAVAALAPGRLMLDGELVALDKAGVSSFAKLQEAFSAKRTKPLIYYVFDLLHQDGADLRPHPLAERRDALEALMRTVPDGGLLRFSEHLASDAARVKQEACAIGLEGIVCKRLDAPYRPGRGADWLKVKCQNREEFVILGYTPPAGSRQGLGSLQLGFHDDTGQLHFIGGCGTGFSAAVLRTLTERLRTLTLDAPRSLLGTETPPRDTIWIRPELVAELAFAGFTGGGMLRHASFLGLREDKPADEVVRPVPPSEVRRVELGTRPPTSRAASKPAPPSARSRIVVATKTERGAAEIAGQRISHADRVLWPAEGELPALTKQDLAQYWQAVADHAAPGIVGRPLAFVRCPDGIGGEQFFQKHLGRGMPPALHEAEAGGAPFVAIGVPAGLVAAAQIAAIELHSWGSTESDPLHADRLVFDLDPGDGVTLPVIVDAALDVKRRLESRGLAAFCRTSGGKGLHVVAPLRAKAGWDDVRAWCRAFAEAMEHDAPDRYVSRMAKKDRDGKILVDWLRNGLGSTAIASYSPRARPGAGVATPLAWREVTPGLDPRRFNLRTIPARLRKQKADPWAGFTDAARDLPETPATTPTKKKA